MVVLFPDKRQDVLHRLRGLVWLLLDTKHEVGAVEALDKVGRIYQAQALRDISHHLIAMPIRERSIVTNKTGERLSTVLYHPTVLYRIALYCTIQCINERTKQNVPMKQNFNRPTL